MRQCVFSVLSLVSGCLTHSIAAHVAWITHWHPSSLSRNSTRGLPCQRAISMLPPPKRDPAAKSRAAAAAAVAAVTVTPGQRERAIQQAVLAAQQQQEKEQAAAEAAAGAGNGSNGEAAGGDSNGAGSSPQPPQPPRAAGTYEPPEWSGVPEGLEYGLEVIKSGTLIEERPLSGKPFLTFGRSPTADVLLEHPSASRLHAVLQFRGSDGRAFLYDCGSTHGTFINKQRVKAQVMAPLRVGDTFVFGQSSRMFVLTGPPELMPEEGLNKQQRRQLAMLEAAQAQKAADEARARAQMEAALGGGGVGGGDGASWGLMGPDAEWEEGAGPSGEGLDWRLHMEKQTLTDKQMKLVDKIRKREYKIKNLEAECSKITAKERTEGGLTQGQASTLVRNERALEALRDELEELEEQLTDSIAASIQGKKAAAAAGVDNAKSVKRKRGAADSDEDLGSDSEDEFYDRTGAPSKKAATAAAGGAGPGGKKGAAGGKAQPAQQVESVETLHAKRSALLEEQQRLEAALAAEQAQLKKQQAAAAAAGTDGRSAAVAAAAAAVAAAEAEAAAEAAAAAGDEGEGVDSLDAFMTDVSQQMEQDKCVSLQKELNSIQQQLQRVDRLLHIADPEGWYKPKQGGGTAAAAAAAAAKAAAKAALEEERLRRATAVAAQRAQQAAQQAEPFEPEVEEDADDTQQQQQQRPDKQGSAAAAPVKPMPVVIRPKGLIPGAKPQPAKPAAVAAVKLPAAAAAGGSSGGAAAEKAAVLMKEFAQPVPAAAGGGGTAKRVVKGPTMPPPGFKPDDSSDKAAVAAAARDGSSGAHSAAAAKVAASIALLTAHRGAAAGAEEEEDEEEQQRQGDGQKQQQGAAGDGGDASGVWLPPRDQAGDGRTPLNEKYGY